MQRQQRQGAGFTLMELLVAVTVVGILAAIAIPSYMTSVQKGRRTDAKNALLELAGREERYYAATNKYSVTFSDLGYPGAWPQPVGSGYYNVTVAPAPGATPGTTYIVSAVPAAGSTQVNDTPCQYFSVDNFATQFSSSTNAGGADNSVVCWH